MQRPNLWIVLTRPDNLVRAVAVAMAARERFAACYLLYEGSAWWDRVDWAGCAAWLDEVKSVARVRTCRGLPDLPRFYRDLRDRQYLLLALQIGPADTIVTLGGITEISAALASAYPGVNKVLCTTVKKYVDASRPYSWRHYRPTTSAWLQRRFLEPLLGLRRTVHLKPWRGGGDGVRLVRLEEPLEEVFETVLLLSNDGTERPRTAGPNVHPAPFPSLHDLGGSSGNPGAGPASVVFFGTPFLLVHNMPPEVYCERLNACLRALRRWYGARCELVYRPHPAETREREVLDLTGFVVARDGQIAELFFLRNSHRVKAVFSVSSTVSRVALNFGLDAYSFWRCFPFKETAARYFTDLMGRVPPEFEVRSLDCPPRAYAHGRSKTLEGSTTFREVMGRLLDQPADRIVRRPAAHRPQLTPVSPAGW